MKIIKKKLVSKWATKSFKKIIGPIIEWQAQQRVLKNYLILKF